MRFEPTPELSTTRYFWVRLAALAAALSALVVSHPVADRIDDSSASSTFATVAVMSAVLLTLVVMGRSVQTIVTSAFSDAYRVFRSRHLLACAALLAAVATLAAGAMATHDPFDKLFAHGRINGVDIVDAGTAVAALVCLVGAGVALTGAWDTRRDERNWHLTLHLHTRRRH